MERIQAEVGLREASVVWRGLRFILQLNAKISPFHFLWTQADAVGETPWGAWWASSMAVIRLANGLRRLFCLKMPYLVSVSPSLRYSSRWMCSQHQALLPGMMGELSQAASMKQR